MRLKIQHCINKACDTLPTLDSHSSAEIVKGSSAPAYKHSRCKQNYGDVFAAHVWANYIHHLYVCVSLCVCVAHVLPWQPAAVSLFVCPWSRERTHTNAGAEIGTEGGGRMTSSWAFHLTSRVNDTHGSPTCFHLSSCRRRLIVLICLICELRALRKWLNWMQH